MSWSLSSASIAMRSSTGRAEKVLEGDSVEDDASPSGRKAVSVDFELHGFIIAAPETPLSSM